MISGLLLEPAIERLQKIMCMKVNFYGHSYFKCMAIVKVKVSCLMSTSTTQGHAGTVMWEIVRGKCKLQTYFVCFTAIVNFYEELQEDKNKVTRPLE